MGFLIARIFVFLSLTLVGSHAAALPLPAQLYWNSVLPNTPMPKTLSELVEPDFITVGKGGVILHNQAYKEDASENNRKYSKDADGNNWDYSKDASENNRKYSKDADGNNWDYSKDADENITLEDPTRVIFFLEKDLHPGKTMNYRLSDNSTREPFLSRKTAESIPFNSSKLSEILNRLSVKPGSEEADIIKETIQRCESPGTIDEVKHCATSLESMIDFTTSTLGRNARAIATEMESGAAPLQKYTIAPGVKKLADNNHMVCHRMNYPYAVFYCHAIKKTRTYMVPLQRADGTKAKAVAACHEDTSAWNPNCYAFKELKVERGTVPICHFLKVENVAWVPNQKPT